MVQKTGQSPVPFPAPPCPWAGFGSSATKRQTMQADCSTNSIESLALIDNYVPPQTESGFVDPILASVVSSSPPASGV